MSERVWSVEQKAIFEDAARGSGNTVVQARAGCGKTTTILGAFDHVPRGASVLMAAFNKGIASELQARAPFNVRVQTLHAFGFSIVRRAFPRVAVDDRKVDAILQESIQDRDMRRELARAVRLAKGTLATEAEQIEELVDAHGIDTFGRREAFVLATADALEESRRRVHVVDYEDMIFLPWALDLPVPGFDRIFIDETQDLNRAQVDLALAACRPGGRICAVGDDRQAIYGFRGADSMARVASALEGRVLGLSTTYRCPKAIVRMANEYVPEFYAAEEAPEGSVVKASICDVKDAEPGDFVLSRTNAPLIGLCLRLLRERTPARIVGKDIAAMLKGRIRKTRAVSVGGMLAQVHEWARKEAADALKRNPEAEVSQYLDVAACISALAEGCRSVDDVAERVDALFDESAKPEDVVTLSTTHKAKGLEADRVWVLRDTYLKKPKREEENLWYVAITRAKRELVVVRGEAA